MTTLTILDMVLIGIIWIILGCWIGYKREWYGYAMSDEQSMRVIGGIIFAPINLIVVIFRIMIMEKWDNQDV
jgi:hypothetical protein